MQEKTQIIANTTYVTLGYIGQKLLAFVYFIIIARLIGTEDLGKYTYALSFTTIFAIFIDLGTSSALIREIAQKKEKAFDYFNSLFATKLLLSGLVYVIVCISINLFSQENLVHTLVYISGLVMILDSLILSLYSIFRGLQRVKFEALGIILNQTIIIIVGTSSLFFISKNVIVLMGAFLVASLTSFVYALSILKFKFKVSIRPKFNFSHIQYLYKTAAPFALSGIFTRIYSNIDALLIKSLVGFTSLGFYSVAYKIPFALQFIPNSFMAAVYPAMSSFHFSSKEKLTKLWEKATVYLTLIALPISFGVAILADKIILRFFTDKYAPAITVLQILIFGLFFMFVNFPLGSLLAASHRQTTNTILIGCTMLINIIANLILLPKYNISGAAIAFLCSHGFLFFASLGVSFKIIEIQIFSLLSKIFKVLLSCLAMGALIYKLEDYVNWLLLIPIGFLFYSLLVILLKVITWQEIRDIIRRIIHKI